MTTNPPPAATVVIVTGGEPPTQLLADRLGTVEAVIAADSGLDGALAVGLSVDRVVGDLDSVSERGLAWARTNGVEVDRHPAAKDDTDLELAVQTAVDVALDRNVGRVVLLGLGGGRIDHFLANLGVLASQPLSGIGRIEAWLDDDTTVTVVRDRPVTLWGNPGDLISLIPVHGDAGNVTTDGLLFPLDRGTLPAGGALGVSNQFVATEAVVVVGTGVVLAIQPGEPGAFAFDRQSSGKQPHAVPNPSD